MLLQHVEFLGLFHPVAHDRATGYVLLLCLTANLPVHGFGYTHGFGHERTLEPLALRCYYLFCLVT